MDPFSSHPGVQVVQFFDIKPNLLDMSMSEYKSQEPDSRENASQSYLHF